MNTLSTTLKHADPLRHEPPRLANAPRLRALVVDAASAPRGATSRLRTIVVAVAAILLVGVFGMRLWPGATVTLTAAAVRFEVRLTEDHPDAGLVDMTIDGSDRHVYLHPDAIVSNADVARAQVVHGDDQSFGVVVTLTASGAEKMRAASRAHIGNSVAILIDGRIVAVPVVRSIIGESATIDGHFAAAEAQRIVAGIRGR